MKKRGQISIEYLIVVGFISFIIIIILGVAFFYTSSIRDRIREHQLQSFAEKIISSAESVYFSGEPSRVTITAYLPDGVESIQIIENSLIFSFSTQGGVSTTSFRSDVPLDDASVLTPAGGGKRIAISAEISPSRVYITEVP